MLEDSLCYIHETDLQTITEYGRSEYAEKRNPFSTINIIPELVPTEAKSMAYQSTDNDGLYNPAKDVVMTIYGLQIVDNFIIFTSLILPYWQTNHKKGMFNIL